VRQGRGEGPAIFVARLADPRPAAARRAPRRRAGRRTIGVAELGTRGDGRAEVITLALVLGALEGLIPKCAWRSSGGWLNFVKSAAYASADGVQRPAPRRPARTVAAQPSLFDEPDQPTDPPPSTLAGLTCHHRPGRQRHCPRLLRQPPPLIRLSTNPFTAQPIPCKHRNLGADRGEGPALARTSPRSTPWAHPGVLGAEQLASALVAAELAQMPLLDVLAEDLQAAVADPDSDSWAELNTLSRAEVSQATGMLVAQVEVEPAEALVRLRAHAFATGRSATDVACDVLDRRLRLQAD
jgi:hypothetical protein